MCFSFCCASCVAVVACVDAPGASSKQALATPEIIPNTHTNSMANALVRLMRVLKKFVMLVSITRIDFIETRLQSVDADQTMANGGGKRRTRA